MDVLFIYTFKRQFYKIVKHTHTIRWQIADELSGCVWPFCGVCAERINLTVARMSLTADFDISLFLVLWFQKQKRRKMKQKVLGLII